MARIGCGDCILPVAIDAVKLYLQAERITEMAIEEKYISQIFNLRNLSAMKLYKVSTPQIIVQCF